MLTKIAVWYLRKRKKSVLIGFEVNEKKVKSMNNDAYVYDNNLINIDYRLPDDQKFNIPEEKFSLSVKRKFNGIQ